jgi:uncharacterized membrane protein
MNADGSARPEIAGDVDVVPASTLVSASSSVAMEPSRRVLSVDIVRGAAMVVMVLDHTRDFAHDAALRVNPLDVMQPDPTAFFTRWITHFVAPAFVLLAGVAARLQLQRGRSRPSLARYLLVRGLFLIALELTVVRFGIFFSTDLSLLALLQVIWVLGASMIVLAGLLFLGDAAVLAFAAVLIVGHNATDGLTVGPPWQEVWALLHGGSFQIGDSTVLVLYPLVPWVGVMALGFVLGRTYEWPQLQRTRLFISLGVGLVVAWVALRWLNAYGDPGLRITYPDPMRTVLSFLNVTKYPPSLDFLLMTLGPVLIVLAIVESRSLGRIGVWLATFGTVPLFFYLTQWYAAHGAAVVMELVAGQDVAWQFMVPVGGPRLIPEDAGFPLWVVYVLWIAIILALYPLCRWYSRQRQRHGGVLRYL